MRKLILALLCCASAVLSACSHRVLVKDCQDVKGTDFKNCELVKKL